MRYANTAIVLEVPDFDCYIRITRRFQVVNMFLMAKTNEKRPLGLYVAVVVVVVVCAAAAAVADDVCVAAAAVVVVRGCCW